MHSSSTEPHCYQIYCQVQNRLGAMDRVFGALTHRGIIPNQIVSTRNDRAGCLQILLGFECDDAKTVEKLVKFLQKQVYVLDVRTLGEQAQPAASTTPSNVTQLFATEPTQRRMAHAHNA